MEEASKPVRTTTRHLEGDIVLTTGVVEFVEGERFDQPIGPGLKILVVLSGEMTIELGSAPETRIGAPAALAIMTGVPTRRLQSFRPGIPYRYVLVDINPELVARELELDLGTAFPDWNGVAAWTARPADKFVQAIAAQALAAGEDPGSRILRLTKALELSRLVLESIGPAAGAALGGRWSSSDVARVRSAREILVAQASRPPGVAEVAAQVGLNARKLTFGFRAVFGVTPYAYLQEHRLQEAYRILASGGRSVGEAAYAVGYGPTHLATLFAKRFGLAPSALIAPRSLAPGRVALLNGDKVLRSK